MIDLSAIFSGGMEISPENLHREEFLSQPLKLDTIELDRGRGNRPFSVAVPFSLKLAEG